MNIKDGTYKGDCECKTWTRMNVFPATIHHPNCKYFYWEYETVPLIQGLLKGIETWAHDEDGVHPELWEAYKNAKLFLGEMVEDKGEE